MYRTSEGKSYAVCRTRVMCALDHCSKGYLPLLVSQFTLLASTKKGSKPDFHDAAGGEQARELYDHFVTKVEELYEKDKVKNGVFAAMMQGIASLRS